MIRDIDPAAAVPDEQIAGSEGEVACEFFENDDAEAQWAAESVARWNAQGIPFSQIAILCNNQPHLYAQKIMGLLNERGIPFRNEQEIQDLGAEPLFCLIVDFLLVILGDAEPDAWERLRRILDSEIVERSSTPRDWDRLLHKAKTALRDNPIFQTAWDLIEELLEKLGDDTIRGLSHDYENGARRNEILANIKGLITSSFNENADPLKALESIGGIDAVRILTIHKCKGLEFHTVVVQGVEQETFWSKDSEANNCAYFVAISRAKKRLIVTNSDIREKLPGANNYWRTHRNRHEKFLGYVEPEIGGAV